MALSEKAKARQKRVKGWIQRHFNAPYWSIYVSQTEKGKITLARMFMLGGLALSKPYGDPAQHVFENDAHWRWVERELKISPLMFFFHVDVQAWRRISANMSRAFYRSKIMIYSTTSKIEPEVLSGFPVFPAASIATGSLDGTYPQDEVLKWLGKIGSQHHHEEGTTGELGLSNDTSMKFLAFVINGSRLKVDLRSTGYNYVHTGGDATFGIYAEATHPHARVELPEPVNFVDGGDDVSLTWKIIAEDDTEKVYTSTISDQ